MTKSPLPLLLLPLLCGCSLVEPEGRDRRALRAVPFHRVRIDDPFWSPRLETNRSATLEACLARCEETGRIANFAIAGGRARGRHQGRLYNDSDLYKVLEGAACTLALARDPELERRLDGIIDLIAAAQQPDGYLNTYYTLVKPQERWHNVAYGHELYCAGHLIEAAVAYKQATGKDTLLEVARRLADHICRVFGPGRRPDPPGHQEIELALIRLGDLLGEQKYIDMARFFVDRRGDASGHELYGEYSQDHRPVREMRQPVGHAVRAAYLYCAMADLVARGEDGGLEEALAAIWRDLVERKMYVTGGVGSSGSNEGFTEAFDLPNDRAYCESCAAIGMALWHHRMFLLTGEGRYADRLEQVLYNGLMAGVSLSGDRFFYRNPLGSRGNHHRTRWYSCACCPPNLLRYIAGLGGRIYAHRGDQAWVVLYIGGSATLPLAGGPVELTQETRYPWEGRVGIRVRPGRSRAFAINLRLPDWFQGSMGLTLNGRPLAPGPVAAGFMRLHRTWRPGDLLELNLSMPVRRIYADKRVVADRGRVALARGPLVYCLEGVDHDGRVRNLLLPREARLSSRHRPDLLGGVVTLEGTGQAAVLGDKGLQWRSRPLRAVPYLLWDNRAPGQMVTWIPEERGLVEPAFADDEPASPGTVTASAPDGLVRASHLWRGDSLAALVDSRLPANSADQGLPRFTWWPRKGGREWVERIFYKPRRLNRVGVYWFDDRTRGGGCGTPGSWRLLAWVDGGWRPVQLLSGQEYRTGADRLQMVEFKPLETTRLRLEAQLRPGLSGGILEWTLE